ncbi:cytochrome c oxidase assembly protein [Bosea sp. Root381]|uniref:cytochrome c oxidase assembly protein n=1 Tax=Bosea sp. Root381 TaxID=1736524 RepID=UPI00191032AA|nr:cytochrome c oxidase assembly protein [Bosea sp. Root381]
MIAALACACATAVLMPRSVRRTYWIAGCSVVAIVFVSPLCALGSALFAARSFHHLLLAAVAAPLLAAAFPARGRAYGLAALLTSSGVLWLWHWPALYTLAYENHAAYWALQIGLLASFVWFWRAVLSAVASPLSAIMLIGAGAGQMGLLAALLTFAPRPLYEVHGLASLSWGLDPLSDQQLGGLLMWVPAFFVYGLFAILAARRGFARASLT